MVKLRSARYVATEAASAALCAGDWGVVVAVATAFRDWVAVAAAVGGTVAVLVTVATARVARGVGVGFSRAKP